MTAFSLIPVFIVGLMGSVHCAGMCGGIVSALSVASGTQRRIRIAVAGGGAVVPDAVFDDVTRVAAYNAGRIGSYAIAGAIAGGLSSGVRALSAMASLQAGGYWLANLMMIALGLYLMQAWHGLAYVEAAGRGLWKRLQPATRHLVPMNTPGRAFLLGGLWGWLPCGMVYSMLLTALLSGSAPMGAAVMIVFGLGTLPMLLALGLAGTRLQAWTRAPAVRVASGFIVLSFGLLGIARVMHGLSFGWLDALCVGSGLH